MGNEILEGNKLIGKFDELKEDSYGRFYKNYKYVGDSPKDFKYHSSWDWLMPVVENIEKLGWLVEIQDDECEILRLHWNIPMAFTGDTKIEAVWLAVVEFIKWYNQKNNNQ